MVPKRWKISTLGEICNGQLQTGPFGSQLHASEYTPDGIPVVMPLNLINGEVNIEGIARIPVNRSNQLEKHKVRNGDILFSRRGDVTRTALITHNEEGYICGTGCLRARPKDEIKSQFINYFINKPQIKKWLEASAVGQTMPNMNTSILAELPLMVPPLPEQQKIAQILSTWDRAIDTLEALIAAKQKRKTALMQQLLTGKRRLPGFGAPAVNGMLPEGWTKLEIGRLLDRVKKSVQVNLEDSYQEIGIRSHGKGIFHKEVIKGDKLGNKSVFWIEPDCFVVNIVFAWEQAVAKTATAEIGMIASHRFPMYRPKVNQIDLDYLVYLFKTSRGKNLLELASPGGAGRNKTLGQKEFAKLQILVPPFPEQQKIAAILSAADREIEIHQRQLDALKTQKKGLMQQLLTGKKRVVLDEADLPTAVGG